MIISRYYNLVIRGTASAASIDHCNKGLPRNKRIFYLEYLLIRLVLELVQAISLISPADHSLYA